LRGGLVTPFFLMVACRAGWPVARFYLFFLWGGSARIDGGAPEGPGPGVCGVFDMRFSGVL